MDKWDLVSSVSVLIFLFLFGCATIKDVGNFFQTSEGQEIEKLGEEIIIDELEHLIQDKIDTKSNNS